MSEQTAVASLFAEPGTSLRRALEESFPIGRKVVLKVCPDSGDAGEVIGYSRGRVRVRWPDWGREGKYMACSLLPAEDRRIGHD